MSLLLWLAAFAKAIAYGVVVTITGYYVFVIIASSLVLPVVAGLLTMLKPDSGHAMWIGHQTLAVFGGSFGFAVRSYSGLVRARRIGHFNWDSHCCVHREFSRSVDGGCYESWF